VFNVKRWRWTSCRGSFRKG